MIVSAIVTGSKRAWPRPSTSLTANRLRSTRSSAPGARCATSLPAAPGSPRRPSRWRPSRQSPRLPCAGPFRACTELASVATASTGRRRRAGSCQRSMRRAAQEESVEVGLELLLDVRPQDLHRYVAALGGARPMHLGDRGCGDRRAEFGEHGPAFRTERRVELRLRLGL